MSERLVKIELMYIKGETVPFVMGIWGRISPASAQEMEDQLQREYPSRDFVIGAEHRDADIVDVTCLVDYDEGWYVHHVEGIKAEVFPEATDTTEERWL